MSEFGPKNIRAPGRGYPRVNRAPVQVRTGMMDPVLEKKTFSYTGSPNTPFVLDLPERTQSIRLYGKGANGGPASDEWGYVTYRETSTHYVDPSTPDGYSKENLGTTYYADPPDNTCETQSISGYGSITTCYIYSSFDNTTDAYTGSPVRVVNAQTGELVGTIPGGVEVDAVLGDAGSFGVPPKAKLYIYIPSGGTITISYLK